MNSDTNDNTGREPEKRNARTVTGIILIALALLLLSPLIVGIARKGIGVLFRIETRKGLVLALIVTSLVLIGFGVRIIRRNRKVVAAHIRELKQHQTKEAIGAVLIIFGLLFSLSTIIPIAMGDVIESTSVKTVLFLSLSIIVSLALIAYGVRIVLRHRNAITTIEEKAILAQSSPPYLTSLGTIQLVPNYVISPSDHSVSDPRRASRTYVLSGLGHFMIYPIVGLIVSILAYFLYAFLRGIDINPQIPRLIKIGTSMLTFCSFCVAILALPYSFFAGGRRLYWCCIRPDLSTPEKAIKCFLRSLKLRLKKRSYNLLTDQAQNLGKLDLTESGHILSKKIGEVVISDFSSFEKWWAWTKVELSWPPAWKKMVRYDISSDACILEFPVLVRYLAASAEHISFRAVFPVVRRDKMWFVAKPFIWPFVLS